MRFRLVSTEKTGRAIRMFALGEDGQKYKISVDDFYPYFFIRERDFREDKAFLDSLSVGGKVEGFEKGHESILDENIVKIITDEPKTVKTLRDRYDRTWEANITYTRRFMVDNGLKDFFEVDDRYVRGDSFSILTDHVEPIEEVEDWDVEETVMGYDIETETHVDPEYPDSPVISISAKIFGDDVLHSFILAPERDFNGAEVIRELDRWVDDNDGQVYDWAKSYFSDERALLKAFADYVSYNSPDVLTGYNNHGFDNPVTHGRMKSNGLSTNRLSPIDLYSYGEKIKGVINADIQKIWTFSQATETKYEELQEVAEHEANYTIPKEKRGELEEKFHEGEYEFIADYNNYDVVALEKVDEVDYTVGSLRNYMRELGIDEYMLTTETQKHLVNCLYVAKEDEKIPTQAQEEKTRKFAGGKVYDPTPGRHEALGVLDLSKIYPTVMYDANVSYETLVREENSSRGLELPNGSRFEQGELGLLPRVVENMFEMRVYYEEKMAEADTHEEYERWYNKRQSVKISTNSLYGVMTNGAFPLFSREIAETITYMARQCLKKCAKVSREFGYNIIYGDTDSVFLDFGTNDMDEVVELGKELEEEVNDTLMDYSKNLGFDRNNFEIEFEGVYERVVFKDKKKRYAGKVVWADGEWLDEDMQYTKIAGFSAVRSSASEVTQDMQKDMIDALLEDKSRRYITSLLRSYYKMVSRGECDITYICPYPQVKQESYDKGNYHVFESIVDSHFLFDLPIERGRYYYVYLEPGNVTVEIPEEAKEEGLEDWAGLERDVEKIAFREEEDLPGYMDYLIDYEKMAEKMVYRKAELILEPIGWGDCLVGMRDVYQSSLKRYGGEG